MGNLISVGNLGVSYRFLVVLVLARGVGDLVRVLALVGGDLLALGAGDLVRGVSDLARGAGDLAWGVGDRWDLRALEVSCKGECAFEVALEV